MNDHKKKLSAAIVISMCLVMAAPQGFAADKIIKETQTHNVFKGFLLSIWGKFKTFNPHDKQVAKSATVYTAGIRGAESTGTLIQPYWKDDLTQDPSFQKQLKMYGEALSHLDKGSLKQANDSLSKFLTAFPSSTLKPTALFAQGISYAGLGDKANASNVLNQFVTEFTNHPLVEDAGNLIKQLN